MRAQRQIHSGFSDIVSVLERAGVLGEGGWVKTSCVSCGDRVPHCGSVGGEVAGLGLEGAAHAELRAPGEVKSGPRVVGLHFADGSVSATAHACAIVSVCMCV